MEFSPSVQVNSSRESAADEWDAELNTSGRSSSCRVSLSAARNAITKATEYVTMAGLFFRMLVFFPF